MEAVPARALDGQATAAATVDQRVFAADLVSERDQIGLGEFPATSTLRARHADDRLCVDHRTQSGQPFPKNRCSFAHAPYENASGTSTSDSFDIRSKFSNPCSRRMGNAATGQLTPVAVGRITAS